MGVGYLTAPILANMVPIQTVSKLGQYLKEGLAVTVGSAVVSKLASRKLGTALFTGGMIHIAVDALRTYVPAFGGEGAGVGYYFPPDDALAMPGIGNGNASCLPPGDAFAQSGAVARYESRF